jgi:hypothetical protein
MPATRCPSALTNVLLEADPADGLRLVATNLDLTVSRRVRATVSVAGRTTVPARLLADYVALLDRGKHVSLSLTSGSHKLHLACDRYEANISTLPADDFPTTPAVDGTIRIQVGGAVLKTAIEQVVFAAAPDDTRPVLAGVLLRLDTGTLNAGCGRWLSTGGPDCFADRYSHAGHVDRPGTHPGRARPCPPVDARPARRAYRHRRRPPIACRPR